MCGWGGVEGKGEGEGEGMWCLLSPFVAGNEGGSGFVVEDKGEEEGMGRIGFRLRTADKMWKS